MFRSSYIGIQTRQGTVKYFCAGLEPAEYDENWAEKTIDMLKDLLEEKGVFVDYRI